jgi:DNA-binding NarL/FixJ family response regulator
LLFGKRSVGSSDVASGHRHFEDEDYIFRSIRAGASGFLLKRMRPEDLIAAVHTVAAGDALLSPSVTRRVIDRMAQQPTPELADQTVVAGPHST